MIESTLYRDHPAWSYFYGRFFFAGMSLLLAADERQAAAAFTLAIALILSVIYGRYRRLYTVTSQRVGLRVGIVANNAREMELIHIRGVDIRQNILERLFGIGNLVIVSSADRNARVVFRGIKKPQTIKKMIYSARELI